MVANRMVAKRMVANSIVANRMVAYIILECSSLVWGGGGGGGVQGLKSWKHDFEITGDPKGPPSVSTFRSCF